MRANPGCTVGALPISPSHPQERSPGSSGCSQREPSGEYWHASGSRGGPDASTANRMGGTSLRIDCLR